MEFQEQTTIFSSKFGARQDNKFEILINILKQYKKKGMFEFNKKKSLKIVQMTVMIKEIVFFGNFMIDLHKIIYIYIYRNFNHMQQFFFQKIHNIMLES